MLPSMLGATVSRIAEAVPTLHCAVFALGKGLLTSPIPIITQVAGYRLMRVCHPPIYAMPAAGYAYAYKKMAVARSVTAPKN